MEGAPAEAIARRFAGGSSVARLDRHPGGHIHDTWFVSAGSRELVLQKLNTRVFPDCLHMMANVVRVAAHLRHRALGAGVADPDRHTVRVLPTDDGSLVAYDAEGEPWRAFERVPGGVSHETVATPEEAHSVGRGLGRFLAHVQNLPGPALVEPIPGFKDFRRRVQDFEFVVDLDPFGRVEGCRREIEAVRSHRRLVRRLRTAEDAGQLPLRIVHNDAKASNVLLDVATNEPLCVIDLDTVAPGTVLFDIGDMLRSATVTSAEDATDLGSLAVSDTLLEAALHGYLSEARDVLSDEEGELIPLAGPLMAYENALRFLTDHLAGDTYYRIERPRHNLDRARAQLRVLETLEQAGERIAELVRAGA